MINSKKQLTSKREIVKINYSKTCEETKIVVDMLLLRAIKQFVKQTGSYPNERYKNIALKTTCGVVSTCGEVVEGIKHNNFKLIIDDAMKLSYDMELDFMKTSHKVAGFSLDSF